jgi:hypothetical protein
MPAATHLLLASIIALSLAALVKGDDLYYLNFESASAVNSTVVGQGLQAFCTKSYPPSLKVLVNAPSEGSCQFSFSFMDPGRNEYQTCLSRFLPRSNSMTANLMPLRTAFFDNGGLMLVDGNTAHSSVTRTMALEPIPSTPSPVGTNATQYSECLVTSPVSSVCDLATCQVTQSVGNGSCSSQYGESAMVTCGGLQEATCAEYITFNSMNCSNASTAEGYFSMVCNTCNLVAIDGLLPYYYFVSCIGSSVVVSHACNKACGNCSNSDHFDVGSCGWAPSFLSPGGFLSVSQLRTCSAVRTTLFSSEGCPEANATVSVVKEQGFCDMSDPVVQASTIICPGYSPQPEVTYPPQQPATLPPLTQAPVSNFNTTVTVTTCSDKHCLQGCAAELHNQSQSSCIPLGDGFARHRCTADNATYSCLGFTMFADAACTQIADLFNIQCNSCLRVPQAGGALRVNCIVGNSSISIDSGCDDACEVCTVLGSELPPNNCSVMPGFGSGPLAYIVPNYPEYCRIVERIMFSDSNCTVEAARGFIAQQQCDKSHTVECDGFVKPPPNPQTIDPLPENPPANAVVAIEYSCSDVHCSTCTAIDAYPDNTCHMPSSSNRYQKVNCIPGVPSCVTVTSFSDAQCSNISSIDSFVCDACNSNDTAGTTHYVCASEGFTTHTGCTATCSSCTEFAPLPYNRCVPGSKSGTYVIANPAAECFSYRIATFTEDDFMCNGTPAATATLPQILCADKKYIECPYNGFTPAPTASHAPYTAAPISILPTSDTTITPAATNSPDVTPAGPTGPPAVTTTGLPPTTTAVPATTTNVVATTTAAGVSTLQPSTATASPATESSAPSTILPNPTSTKSPALPSGAPSTSSPETVSPVASSTAPSTAWTNAPSPPAVTSVPPTMPIPTAPSGFLTFSVTFLNSLAEANFLSTLRTFFKNSNTSIVVLSSASLNQTFYFSDSNAQQEQHVFNMTVVNNAAEEQSLGLAAASLIPRALPPNSPPSPPSGLGTNLIIVIAAAGGGALLVLIIVVLLVRRRKSHLVGSREYISMKEYESGRLN